jgi:hypothetical protein
VDGRGRLAQPLNGRGRWRPGGFHIHKLPAIWGLSVRHCTDAAAREALRLIVPKEAVVSERPASLKATIPTVHCPRCAGRMRLATILPDGQGRDRMTFSCNCGFDYQQSSTGSPERML